MPHTAAWRRGEAGDEADHRLVRHIFLDPFVGVFFGIAADLANHDHSLGLGILFELLQAVNKAGAVDGIAADADAGGLAKAGQDELINRLVSQRSGAGDNAPGGARLDDGGRHNADFAGARGSLDRKSVV